MEHSKEEQAIITAHTATTVGNIVYHDESDEVIQSRIDDNAKRLADYYEVLANGEV